MGEECKVPRADMDACEEAVLKEQQIVLLSRNR